MRLLTRLLVSHTVPVLLVAAALALLLTALVKMSLVLTTLNEAELGTLRDEGTLHRATWALDVTLRHNYDECLRGVDNEASRARIREKVGALTQTMKMTPAGAIMLPLAREYRNLGESLATGEGCERWLTTSAWSERELLDERLTDLWVKRLHVLHGAVSEKEEEVRRMSVAATWIGLSLTLASILLALRVAQRMARSLCAPLVALSESARRVGRGDFKTAVAIDGPIELRELGDELERMRLQLAQIDVLKQGFLASVSHELRTPLSKIREALSLFHDGVVGTIDPRQHRVLAIARQACEREIRMVTTLLDLSRLRSGSPMRLREGTSIDTIIESAVSDERMEAEQRGVVLDIHHDGEVPTTSLDPVLLERAIANLIRNAVSVSARGQRVTVRRSIGGAESADPDDRRIRLLISDSGPGVPEAIRKIMFEPFVTQAIPQSGKTLGVGLGLALAREIARAHGGDLFLEESVSKGATFHLSLPLYRRSSSVELHDDEGEHAA